MGDITADKLEILRNADAVLQDEMMASGYYWKVWQSFAVFLPVKTVGVFGDERTYDYVIALRIVESIDAMTADWAKLPARPPAKNLQPHYQRGPRRQPCRARHQFQAARYHRVGVILSLHSAPSRATFPYLPTMISSHVRRIAFRAAPFALAAALHAEPAIIGKRGPSSAPKRRSMASNRSTMSARS